MKFGYPAMAAALGLAFCGSVLAQAGTIQRDVNQQQRIEQGLRSGELTTRETARLERERNSASRDIYREKHDARKGDPSSVSSRRMQADVQRNVNQQRRIEQGVRSSEVTNREAARLERGQARVQKAENRESRKIHREKHDAQQK